MFNSKNNAYLIAEIGINHNGDMSIAKRLIDASYAIGWDCVKFQKRDPEVAVPENQKNIIRSTPWGDMKYIDYKKKIEFQEKEYLEIESYCRSKDPKIDWTVSVWDIESLNFIKSYNVPFIKIPSAHLNNFKLLEKCIDTGIPLILSTGMSTLEEIDDSVNILIKKNYEFALLHCNSSYPAPIEELNLSLIPFYKERYDCVIGYSGHEANIEPSVVAVALGAKIIERHITLSHNLWGTDQKSSLEIDGMDKLYNRIRDIDKMIGVPKKVITKSEEEVRKKLRGS